MTVELLTAALWHDSTGDLAIAQVVAQQLALRGVPVVPVARASGERTCVIGGGAILTGDRQGMWWDALEPFHAPGKHILNGVTAVSGRDFSHLKDYLYVTARDEPSRQRMLKDRPDAVCVPCCTALMDPPNVPYLAALPNYGWLKRLVGTEYVLVDVEAKNVKLKEKTVSVGTRPWCQTGKPDVLTRHPDTLLAAICEAKAVIAGSLHLSILSVAMGKPTVFVRNGSAWKGDSYWGRAEFKEIMYQGSDPVGHALSLQSRIAEVREAEREKAKAHVDRMVEVLTVCG